MRFSEFKRELEKRGVVFKNGKKHYKLYFGDRRSTFPRHQGQEVGETLRKLILKQLGLSD
jgi:mRNA interferase HicA